MAKSAKFKSTPEKRYSIRSAELFAVKNSI